MSRPSDSFVVSKTEITVIRRCPFCEELIEDEAGHDIEFIVHLGTPISKHQLTRAWADYITTMNHI